MGARCRKLCQSWKGRKLSDGKGMTGKGRLTDKAINTLQNYFGMATLREETFTEETFASREKKTFSHFFLHGFLEGSVSKYLELFSS